MTRNILIVVIVLLAIGAGFGYFYLRETKALEDALATHRPALSTGAAADRVDAAAALTDLRSGWFSDPIDGARDDILGALAAGLEADEADTRAKAAETIAHWGDAADDLIRRSLEAEDDATRIAAAHSVALRPRPALRKVLSTALRDRRVEVRAYAADALGRTPLPTIDEEMIADLVFRLWKDDDEWARNAAAEALFNQDNWTGIPMLINNLNGRFWKRFNAYERLQRMFARAGKPLPPFYADGPVGQRDAEVKAIENAVLGDPELHARVLAHLAEYKSQIMTATRWTVHLMGRHIVPSLAEVLGGGGPSFADQKKAKFVRVHAAQGLADLADPGQSAPATYRENLVVLREVALPVLRRAASDPKARTDIDVTIHVLRALGHLGGDADVALLSPLMADQNPDIAITAIQTIGRIGGPAAARALEGLEATGEREAERTRALEAAKRTAQ